MADRVGPRFSFDVVLPSVNMPSKRHNSDMDVLAKPAPLPDIVASEVDEQEFFSREVLSLEARVVKVAKRSNLGSESPESNSLLGAGMLTTSSESAGSRSDSDTPPPVQSAFQLPRPDMFGFEPARSAETGLVLPDMGAFETNYGAVTTGLRVPKTPAPKVRLDAFRSHILDMLDEEEIVIEKDVVRIGRAIGTGRFSVVHLLSNGDVAKFPNDLKQTTTRKIQNDQRSSYIQYRQLCAMKEQLAAINIGVVPTTFREDGVIIQPFCESFVPTWNKDTRMSDLLPGEKLLLKTAKTAFAFFFKNGIPVDFRPDNMALDPTNPALLHIRDFYEMDDDGKDKFKDFVWDLLEKWALGNKEIYEYLDPRPKVASPVRI